MESLAVKYRPQTFDDVVEQNSIKTILGHQLKTNTIKHAYLFVGSAGCGKTTTARIFANEINKGEGTPIEIDAASHNGVDDVREVIESSKVQSIDSEYKIYILDECVTGDTEILTDQGFKRFDACDGTERVAQYTNYGTIQFVTPTKWIKHKYTGDLVKWSPRNWCSVRMTPNHVQPLYYTKSKQIKEQYAKNLKFSQANNLITGGLGTGNKAKLTAIDKLVIASQADGTIQKRYDDHVHWSIQLSKDRKIKRFLALCEEADITPTKIRGRVGCTRFTYDLPSTSGKLLSDHFTLTDFSAHCAEEFIDEVALWDGYTGAGYKQYISTVKENCDFVSAVGALCAYSARQRVQIDKRKSTYKPCYKVFLYPKNYVNCAYVAKTVTSEAYDDYVYCVKVPSQKIVVRAGGFTFITGNCHMLSTSAWNAMLKLIEEPPAKAIFIFCTTDPQKIPQTILSRVQRYDFQKISQEGIYNRLTDIIKMENGEQGYTYSADTDALQYIAKLADGGMRTAISLMDKCLSYSSELTVESVVSALGVADYADYTQLAQAWVTRQPKDAVAVLEQVGAQGKDIKQFVRGFLSFCLDVCKYAVTREFAYIKIPNTQDYKTLLDKWAGALDSFKHIVGVLIVLNSDLKWEQDAFTLAEAVIFRECCE